MIPIGKPSFTSLHKSQQITGLPRLPAHPNEKPPMKTPKPHPNPLHRPARHHCQSPFAPTARLSRKLAGALLLAVGFATSVPTHADITTVPTGLIPGDSYRLIFVTSTTTQATESSASYYNNFVHNLAVSVPELAALDTTWTVAGNLNGIGPWENTGTEGNDDIPIYRLDGQVFAANYTAFKGAPTVAVAINEIGEATGGAVWTGMRETMSVPSFNASEYIGNGSNTHRGLAGNAWNTWGSSASDPTSEFRLYAMSGVLTVPGEIEGFIVTFNSNGGSTVQTQLVDENATATEPADPTRTGYSFNGWFSDEALTLSYDFATPVTADITLYADWTINSYTLTYTAGENGTISGTSPQTVEHGSSGSSVTAVADSDFVFLKWSDNSTNNPRTDSNVTGDITVTAEFIPAPTIVTVPTGLEPGDSYRLIFVTSATTQATESSASYYNDFVHNLAVSVPALAALNTTWTVAGNLNGIGPWENTGTEGDDDIPIYRLDDVVFAANYTALKAAPTVSVLIRENGTENTGSIWTGMGEVMSVPTFGTSTYIGHGGNTGRGHNNTWNTWGSNTRPATEEHALYAMSGVLTVGGGPVAPYDAWAAQFPDADLSDPNADFNGDGLTNFEKFAFGLDPTSGASVNPITDISEITDGIFSYTRHEDSGLTYTYWISTDLQDWGTEPATVVFEDPGVADEDGVQTVSVLIELPEESDKLFLRVKAE